MKLYLTKLFLLLSLFLFAASVSAQFKIDFSGKNPLANMSLQTWLYDDGLPTNDVYDIIQSEDGFYYLGTSNGFVRFDGAEFKVYSTKNNPLIKANVTRNLFIDSKGKIWIANGGGGVLIYEKGNFKRLSEDDGLSLNHPSAFEEDSDGRIYIGTFGGGLNIYEKGKFIALKKENGLLSNSISSLLIDSNKRLWIGSTSGDLVFIENGKIKKFFDHTYKLFTQISKIFEDSKGTIWVATDNGLLKIENNFSVRDDNLKTMERIPVSSITEDDGNNIWFSTSVGIYVYNGDRIIHINKQNILHSNRISTVLLTNEGIWYCGSGSGFARITLNTVNVISENDGLLSKEARSIFQDNRGLIWIGTNSGLSRYDEKSERIIPFNSKIPILLSYSFESNSKGEVFIGTRLSGVWIYYNGTFKNIANKKILGTHFIRSLYYNNDSTLWIGTNGYGVALYKDGKFNFINKSKGLTSEFVACIIKSKSGDFWVGTSGGGISHIDKNGNVLKSYTEKEGLASNIVNSIYEGDDGVIWIATSVSGISRLKNGKIFNINESHGIYSNAIKKMIYDNDGKFWFTTEFGLFSIKKNILSDFADGKISKVTFNLYGKKDGMKSEEFLGLSNNSACVTNSGKLYFSSTDGVVIIEPLKLITNDDPPKVYIDEVFANYELINKDKISSFSPGTEIIQFNYGGISINYSKNLSFKYILEGLDTNWADVGKRRQAFFTYLPYGNYTFRVVAIAPDGSRSNNIASINFTIEPFIWQTLWFRIGFLLFLITASALIVRYILRRKYKARLDKLEAEAAIERERVRISKDMHDDLGASLTRITLLGELAKNNVGDKEKTLNDLNKISQVGREVAYSLDEIVWAVNPKNDKLEDLVIYTAQYLQEYFTAASTELQLIIPASFPEKFVTSEFRHNIFLVIKEAANNIVKHAEAAKVIFSALLTNASLKIKLTDDGKGIDFENINKYSNGLENMKKRIYDINGELKIFNEEFKGASIVIEVPL